MLNFILQNSLEIFYLLFGVGLFVALVSAAYFFVHAGRTLSKTEKTIEDIHSFISYLHGAVETLQSMAQIPKMVGARFAEIFAEKAKKHYEHPETDDGYCAHKHKAGHYDKEGSESKMD